MDHKQIFDMADKLKALKERKKQLEEETKANNAEIEALDTALSDAMAEAELDKFSRNGTTFYLASRLYASPLNGDKETMFAALRAHNFGSLITESVNANTLASFVKEQRSLNKEQTPAWLEAVVKTTDKVTVGVRKS